MSANVLLRIVFVSGAPLLHIYGTDCTQPQSVSLLEKRLLNRPFPLINLVVKQWLMNVALLMLLVFQACIVQPSSEAPSPFGTVNAR